jgi:hypothetical protein
MYLVSTLPWTPTTLSSRVIQRCAYRIREKEREGEREMKATRTNEIKNVLEQNIHGTPSNETKLNPFFNTKTTVFHTLSGCWYSSRNSEAITRSLRRNSKWFRLVSSRSDTWLLSRWSSYCRWGRKLLKKVCTDHLKVFLHRIRLIFTIKTKILTLEEK